MQPQRSTLRIAQCIRERLLLLRWRQSRAKQQKLAQMMEPTEQLVRIHRLLTKAGRHCYEGACKRLLSRAGRTINDIQYHMSNVNSALAISTPTVPGVGDLLRELDQTEQEFGSWSYEAHDDTVRVTTDAIELEGRYLGPFEIRLALSELESLPMRPPFLVVAQDPHPASGADHVTHPHVSDDRLCAGEAVTAINAAIESGRLCDFFVLVRSVLTNYNPDSPYVSLDDWDGEQCEDCGGGVYEDTRCYCEICDRTYCSDCMGSCTLCDESTCLGCLKVCPHCNESTCSQCLGMCQACDDACCSDCLQDGICPNCQEQQEESNNAPTPGSIEEVHQSPSQSEAENPQTPTPVTGADATRTSAA